MPKDNNNLSQTIVSVPTVPLYISPVEMLSLLKIVDVGAPEALLTDIITQDIIKSIALFILASVRENINEGDYNYPAAALSINKMLNINMISKQSD